jgi:hypothetical protein
MSPGVSADVLKLAPIGAHVNRLSKNIFTAQP